MSPSPEDNRLRWIRDLGACLQWHKEKAVETKPIIIGATRSDENVLHNVFYNAILDALILVENLPLATDEEADLPNLIIEEEDEDTSDS
tara:strand:- start:1985 stop:2251 length:267 start_codon:yes stop_codon:yes gene_type:complete